MNLAVIDEDRLREIIREELTGVLQPRIEEEKAPPAPKVLSLVEAADQLHVSVTTVRRMIRTNQLEAFKIRSRLYARQMDIDNWIQHQMHGGQTFDGFGD